MSFVEGISSVGIDVAEPEFALCVSGIVLLVGLLLTVPTLATTLRLFGRDHALGRAICHLLRAFHRFHK